MRIKNINHIDGTSNELQKEVDVIIEDNQFKTIGKNLENSNQEIIDGRNKYLLPRMIDSHVHIMEEMRPLDEKLTTPFSYTFYRAIDHLRRTVNCGITIVRDALGADHGIKEEVLYVFIL